MAARVSLSFLLVMAASAAFASGPVGIFGVIERVVFEPDEATAERVQVWGAFVYADGGEATETSPVGRGYLYFRLPASSLARPGELDLVRREWQDLKAVAGTGQAVAFGQWGYIGGFSGLRPDASRTNPPYILERAPQGGAQADLRVRSASESPSRPAAYQTNAGIVKLPDGGSHAEVVRVLRSALARK
jgi:hypothetical protein